MSCWGFSVAEQYIWGTTKHFSFNIIQTPVICLDWPCNVTKQYSIKGHLYIPECTYMIWLCPCIAGVVSSAPGYGLTTLPIPESAVPNNGKVGYPVLCPHSVLQVVFLGPLSWRVVGLSVCLSVNTCNSATNVWIFFQNWWEYSLEEYN